MQNITWEQNLGFMSCYCRQGKLIEDGWLENVKLQFAFTETIIGNYELLN